MDRALPPINNYFYIIFSYSTRQNLNKHINAIHEKIKPFKCDLCDYACSQKSSMNSHKKHVHEGFKFTCDSCDKQFSSRRNLTAHVEGYHNKNKDSNIYCDPCDKFYATPASFQQHVESVHEGTKYR